MMRWQSWLSIGLCIIVAGLAFWLLSTRNAYISPEAEINPGRFYTLEFWDYSLPLVWADGTTYPEFVEQVVAEFEAKYPNVTIQHQMLSFSEGAELLHQALSRGSPPDVYSEPFSRGIIYHRGLQLPITPFLTPREKDSYNPRVLASLEAGGDIWGWPAWVSPLIWIGNRQLLEAGGLDTGQVQTLGWNWEEFLTIARRVDKNSDDHKFAFFIGPGETQLFCCLLNNNGLTFLEEAMEEKENISFALDKTAAFMGVLSSEGLWQETDPEQSWLEEFWEGRAAVVGPVNTWVLRGPGGTIYPARHRPDLVFLPPPHEIGAREYLEPEIAQVRVFRQRRFQGADKVKVAMEFARYFSRRQGEAVAPRLWSLPAYNPWLLLNKEDNEISPDNTRFLLRSQEYLLTLPVDPTLWEQEQKWRQEILDPSLQKFLAREITSQEFALQVMQGLEGE